MTPPKYSARVRNKPDYALASGVQAPGVTTVLKVLDKSSFLVPWAVKMTKSGVDAIRYRDEKAMVGTLAHLMCLSTLKGVPPELYDYSPREVDLATNAFGKFKAWTKAHTIEPILVETPMVSEICGFGGTPDFYGYVDGELTLMDLKTGNIYHEHWFQMAAYCMLLEERKHDVRQRILLNIGRDETENFVEAKRSGPARDDEVLIFRACLEIYNAKKRLKYD